MEKGMSVAVALKEVAVRGKSGSPVGRWGEFPGPELAGVPLKCGPWLMREYASSPPVSDPEPGAELGLEFRRKAKRL
jgi:hypothetical protein